MIVDCVLYNGEADMLELRINELAGVVDRFVVVEGPETFTGQNKALSGVGQLARTFELKYWIAGYALIQSNAWEREAKQRNAIRAALNTLHPQPDDVILVSDVDEIPKAAAVELAASLIRDGERQVAFQQTVYFYSPLCRNNLLWYGTRAIRYGDMTTPQALRATEYLRDGEASIAAAGWHFSYFMDAETIQRKVASYSHTEVNRPPYNTIENIEAAIRNCRSIVPGDGQTFTCLAELPDDLPAFMLEHPERYGLAPDSLRFSDPEAYAKARGGVLLSSGLIGYPK